MNANSTMPTLDEGCTGHLLRREWRSLSVDSRLTTRPWRVDAIHVQRPRLQGKVTGCPSGTRLVPVLESFSGDVLRGVVISVVLAVALQTTELVAVAVVFVGEAKPSVRSRVTLSYISDGRSCDG